MRITKPKRAKSGAKRLDLSDMRELFKDRRMWCAVGTVTAPEGEAHWHIASNDSGTAVDVIIEVVLQPSEDPVSCRLRGGIWEVPNVGDEVAVLLPEGALDFMPIVVCKLSGRSVPTTQGPTPGNIVIAVPAGMQVLVHDGSGGAVPLALKSDVESVNAKYTHHVHLSPAGATGEPLATTLPNPPNPLFPATDPVNPYITLVGSVPTTNPDSEGLGLTEATIAGTTVLKGK